jgi:4-aminobutyrate aminotransferase-like enzyme
LNTHTRYLHDLVLDYIERLTATLGHGLSQAIMVCTGSEANDIALRMAQAVTGGLGIIATDATYHGNTAAVSQLSTRKPPIGGYAPHVRLVPAPGPMVSSATFGANVAAAAADLAAKGFGPASLLICPIFANEGLPTVTKGWLDPAVTAIRAAGGMVISDEVQPGLGRCATQFWGHDWLGITPDIVTMGKPMGNGHPVAAVVTRPDVMAAFRNAFGYFNTFGGNPVSAAAALAVLDVIADEGLVDRAATTHLHLMDRLHALRHPLIHDIRGVGQFYGVEFRANGAPATDFVADLVERMVARGFILNKIGPGGATLKIRPPMPFGIDHADLLADALQAELA